MTGKILKVFIMYKLNIEPYRVKLAQMGIDKKQYFDLNKPDEFWMHHFLQKYIPLCKKLNIPFEMRYYNFLIYLYCLFCFNTKSILYPLDYFISYFKKWINRNFYTDIDIFCEIYKPKYLNLIKNYPLKTYDIYFNFPKLNDINLINEILDCYNLKIKFIYPPAKYVSVRKN